MVELLDLAEMEGDEEELIPEILPIDTRVAFEANVEELLSAVSGPADLLPAKEFIPHTQSLRFISSTSNSGLSELIVVATDGDRSMRVSLPVKTLFAGDVLLPGKKFLEILRLAPDSHIRVDVLGTTATIRSGRAVWNISTPPTHAKLPSSADLSDTDEYTFERESLRRALLRAFPAISKSTSRQALMQVQIAEGAILSCDGVRAHKVSLDGAPGSLRATMPLRFVESALKFLSQPVDDTARMFVSSSSVALKLGNKTLVGQRLAFDFPDVNSLVLGPALLNTETLRVDTKELISTIKRLRVTADPEYFSVVLAIRVLNDETTLTVRCLDKVGNSSQETLKVSGDVSPQDIVLNHKHLTDFLICVDEEYADLKLGENKKNKHSPIYVKTDDFEGALMTIAPPVVRS